MTSHPANSVLLHTARKLFIYLITYRMSYTVLSFTVYWLMSILNERLLTYLPKMNSIINIWFTPCISLH